MEISNICRKTAAVSQSYFGAMVCSRLNMALENKYKMLAVCTFYESRIAQIIRSPWFLSDLDVGKE